MQNIKFLDCTLRDGAHVVEGEFKQECIVKVIQKLTESNVEIIEIGFLKDCKYNEDKINYPNIEDLYGVLDKIGINGRDSKTIYAVMARADEYDINNLTPANGRVKLIRVAFYYDYLSGGIQFVRRAMELGYICSVNLINTPGCTKEQLKYFVEEVNKVNPFAVSIVDTFGVFSIEEMEEIVRMYDEYLNRDIHIGLHVHENLSLAFALGQRFLKIVNEDRNVIVDGSLMGLGRAPGNLCTELMTSYLNKKYEKKYIMYPIMEAIERYIKPFKKIFKWGYSPEFALSAEYRVHRSYAEYLERRGVQLELINTLLAMIDENHAMKFDQKYIEELVKQRGLI